MFAARYFAERQFAPHYFPKLGATVGASTVLGARGLGAALRSDRASKPAPVVAPAAARPRMPSPAERAAARAEEEALVVLLLGG